ncbi:MAG: replication protein [Bacteroidales bacterium]|nr:replication protein [Bacteroidales bacterium]
MDIKKFRETLQKRPIETRFKIDKYVDDIPIMLRECYIDEVARRGVEFKNDEATIEHLNKAAKWITGNFKPGLLLYGSVGNGKTTLIRAISRLVGILYYSTYSDERKYIVPVSALELANIAKEETVRFESMKKAGLLAIDDVGVEPSIIKVWGNEISPFVDTIYYRYDRQLFTIMTSNLSDEQLADKYGERIADRFTEMFDKIHFENKTYRR